MRRRKREDEPDHRDRWMVSYADFITLLFAFFVVMYSVSSVNEGKYKVLSETLSGVFKTHQRAPTPAQPAESVPVQGASEETPTAEPQVPEPVSEPTPEPTLEPAEPLPPPEDPVVSPEPVPDAFRQMADRFANEFKSLMDLGLVTVGLSQDWIEVSLPNSILFGSGEADPHRDAFEVIEAVADILRDSSNAVLVEGFTDNVPIRSGRYPSNWELSSARAATVVRLLVEAGIEPARLAAVGYGEHQAVARNDTAEGRRRNRRVVLLISRQDSVRAVLR
ncbi:MAG: flagellar motor protein MotD [Gammaproteobacteria bacterium]|nr:flagellar motor protein MotD [Gammaproteobacteria bacterium]